MNETVQRRAALRRLASIALGAAALSGANPLAAQEPYPSKPIRLVVPFPPGGAVDTVGRLIAGPLSRRLGQSVVVENKGGANGAIGAAVVRDAAADGYTLLIHAPNFLIAPLVVAKPPYDPLADFTPIAQVGYVPQLVLANPALPYKDLAQFLKAARSGPDIKWATPSQGGAQHIAIEILRAQAEAKSPLVTYRGGGPALTDLMGGHISVMVEPIPSSIGFVQAGRVKPLAVTSAQRVASLPDVPTVAESGVPGFDLPSWYGLWAPKNLPEAIRARLARELRTVLASAELKPKLEAIAFNVSKQGPDEFRKFLDAETAKYRAVVARAGIRID